jgi:hypothetical protein
VNYAAGLIRYTVVDKPDPIMKDMSDITIQDESFYLITWAKNPPVHVLATTVIPPRASRAGSQPARGGEARANAPDHTGEVVPQMWRYEHTLPGGCVFRRCRSVIPTGCRSRSERSDAGETIVAELIGIRQVESVFTVLPP